MKAISFEYVFLASIQFSLFIFTGAVFENNGEQYIYRFVTLDEVNPEEFPDESDDRGINTFDTFEKFNEKYQLSKNQKDVPFSVENLFTMLEGFETYKCLIVIDNWESVNIKQKGAIPVILRQLELAFSHRKLHLYDSNVQHFDAVLIPTKPSFKNKTFSKYNLEDGKYHKCPTSYLYSPLIADEFNDAFCVNIKHEIFLLKSRPWQCEIQLGLLIPEILLRNSVFPGFFRYNYANRAGENFKFMPSSRQKIQILLDFRSVQDFELVNLLDWISNFKLDEVGYSSFKIDYSSQNNVHLTGQMICIKYKNKIIFESTCKVSALIYIDYCIDCPTLVVSEPLNQNFLSYPELDRVRQDNLWLAQFICNRYTKELGLCNKMPYFLENEPKAITTPLKNLHKMKTKYSNSIVILAFAFTAALRNLLGNYTLEQGPFFDSFYQKCQIHLLVRIAYLDESLFDDRNVALSFENKFRSLRFVSCGSRGLDQLQIGQFVSVFEIHVWIWLFAFAALLVVVMNILRGSLSLLLSANKFTSVLKVLLEQGDPFPERFTKSDSFRFLICGTLLGGVVLSNAFKSTNVYNIVLPKQPLKFRTIDELLEHGYSVYSKLAKIKYNLRSADDVLLPTKPVIQDFFGSKTLNLFNSKRSMFQSDTEIYLYEAAISDLPDKLIEQDKNSVHYLINSTGPHFGLHKIIAEPLKILRPLLQIGMMSLATVERSIEIVKFWGKQENFIRDDLKKCNKSAWLLPEYQAQQLTKMLYRSKKHSDVGVTAYFRTDFNFHFNGAMPSHLIQRLSLVSSSGLLNWWANLINRTDLVRRSETEPPVKPTMSGNIQIIFLMLVFGMLVGQISLILELHGSIFKICSVFASASLCVVQKLKVICFWNIRETRVENFA